MTEGIKQKAKEYAHNNYEILIDTDDAFVTSEAYLEQGYLAGAKENGIQWHDLRKDSNDLPDSDREVIVQHEDEDSEVDAYIREDDYVGWRSLRWDIEYYQRKGEPIPDFGIIMWCEKPRFKGE